jgi:hypothetical protein
MLKLCNASGTDGCPKTILTQNYLLKLYNASELDACPYNFDSELPTNPNHNTELKLYICGS